MAVVLGLVHDARNRKITTKLGQIPQHRLRAILAAFAADIVRLHHNLALALAEHAQLARLATELHRQAIKANCFAKRAVEAFGLNHRLERSQILLTRLVLALYHAIDCQHQTIQLLAGFYNDGF